MKTGKGLLCIFLVLILAACGMLAYLHVQEGDISDWEEHYNLGIRYLSEGNYEEAILAFSAAIEIAPNRPEAYIARGDAYFGLGNFEAAQRDYESALDLTSENNQEILEKLEVAKEADAAISSDGSETAAAEGEETTGETEPGEEATEDTTSTQPTEENAYTPAPKTERNEPVDTTPVQTEPAADDASETEQPASEGSNPWDNDEIIEDPGVLIG